jgi:hypothetical protein
LHQTAIGDNILAPREAGAIRDFVEPHAAEDCADTGPGVPQRQGVGVMGLGGVAERALNSPQPLIVGGDARQVAGETLLSRGGSKTLGNARTVGRVGTLFAPGRQGLRAGGMLAVCQERGAWVGSRHPAAQQVAGGTPLGGRDRGVREHPAAQQCRHLVRIACVVFGLPAMDGLHIAGMPKDDREPCVGTEVGEPVPGEHTLDRHDNPLSIRGNGVQKGLRSGCHSAMPQDLAVRVEDAEGHRTGMAVDPAVKWVRRGVQSP